MANVASRAAMTDSAAKRAAERELDTLRKSALQLQDEAQRRGGLNGGRHMVTLAEQCCAGFLRASRAAVDTILQHDSADAQAHENALKVLLKSLQLAAATAFDSYGGISKAFGHDAVRERLQLRQALEAAEVEILEDFALRSSPAPSNRPAATSPAKPPYIDPIRLEALAKKQGSHDLTRLIRLCEEMNTAWQGDAFHAVAMLVRATLDHVPPLFSQPSFAAVAASYAGAKSFKQAMAHLDGSSRAIADGHLHIQVRAREAIPTANQVDFRSGLDALLAEIDRIA